MDSHFKSPVWDIGPLASDWLPAMRDDGHAKVISEPAVFLVADLRDKNIGAAVVTVIVRTARRPAGRPGVTHYVGVARGIHSNGSA